MTVTLDDLGSALGGFLGSLCKSVKSHHRKVPFSTVLFINGLTVYTYFGLNFQVKNFTR
jgi:hypothetical protein